MIRKRFADGSFTANRSGIPRILTRSILLTLFLISISGFLSARAATLPAGFAETQVANGLTSPTAMDFAPDGRLFVCLQGGNLRVIKNGGLLATPFLTLTVDSSGERGLLGVTFDPNFASNNFVYVYYTVPGSPAHNRVSRFTANGDVALGGSELCSRPAMSESISSPISAPVGFDCSIPQTIPQQILPAESRNRSI